MATLKHKTADEVREEKRQSKIQSVKNECERRIKQKWSIEKQLSADNEAEGYTAQDKADKDAWVDDHIKASHDLEALIEQSDDPASIDVGDDSYWP